MGVARVVAEPMDSWSRPVGRGSGAGDVAGLDIPASGHPQSLSAVSDEMLVALALENRERFSDLYLRYADRIYRYAIGRTRSATTADDIVSDTMIAALEGLHTFNAAKGSFAGWLFTIASRRIADRDRKQRQFWKFLERRPPSAADFEGEDALASALRSEQQDRVRAAIATLSERHQQVILLRYVADLPIRDVGEVLDISEGAVKMRLNRAMQVLAKELVPDGR
jgi:RNA polymerase sigma factor (sigma-70 family)